MITENEIRNQLAIAKSKKGDKDWDYVDVEEKWALYGYMHGLAYALGEVVPKFKKEDI